MLRVVQILRPAPFHEAGTRPRLHRGIIRCRSDSSRLAPSIHAFDRLLTTCASLTSCFARALPPKSILKRQLKSVVHLVEVTLRHCTVTRKSQWHEPATQKLPRELADLGESWRWTAQITANSVFPRVSVSEYRIIPSTSALKGATWKPCWSPTAPSGCIM